MPFWTYMLHCRDRTFYVGHTDDLDVRLAAHEQGAFGGCTARKRPLKLVWCAEFPTRHEALAAERQIKGWRREKKLALIRGDWELISKLAQGREGRPSTGSGRPGNGQDHLLPFPRSVGPEPDEGRHYLLRHPRQPGSAIASLVVDLLPRVDALDLRYTLTGEMSLLAIPVPTESRRQNELWRHTCFEIFISRADGTYLEFNFSPSSEWAAYSFSEYRGNMVALRTEPPQIVTRARDHELQVDVQLPIPLGNDRGRLNLAAVIEEKSGTKSYWALAHPPEGPPDFHHPDCFVLELPPAAGA